MTGLNHKLFLEALQKALGTIQEQSPGLVVIWGSCEYFSHKALNAIRMTWKEKSSSSNASWSGEDLKKNQFLELCEQRNLFEKASLHIIRNVKKQADLNNWLNSLSNPPQNLIVISIEGDKLNSKLEETVRRLQALLVPCQKPMRSELSGIANQLLKKRKLKLDPEALGDLLVSVGEDLYVLENEIERLSLIFTNETVVVSSQLAPLLHSLSEEQSFKLVTLLLDGKTLQAQLFISELLRQGESPIGIAGLIAWHCRNTLKMFESASRSGGKAPTIRISYSLLKNYQHYIRRVKPLHVIKALLQCQSVDSDLKSTSRPPEDLLSTPLLLLAGM
jgi:DNA polymerase III delta subunit